MRFTARARLDIWANLSYVQSDEATYGLQMESTSLVASNRLGSSGDGSRCVDVDALEHATGNRWMEMNDDAENMRLECERAWREVDAIAKERDALRAEVEALTAAADALEAMQAAPTLTDEQILALLSEYTTYDLQANEEPPLVEDNYGSRRYASRFIEFARAIERAVRGQR